MKIEIRFEIELNQLKLRIELKNEMIKKRFYKFDLLTKQVCCCVDFTYVNTKVFKKDVLSLSFFSLAVFTAAQNHFYNLT